MVGEISSSQKVSGAAGPDTVCGNQAAAPRHSRKEHWVRHTDELDYTNVELVPSRAV